MPAVTLDSRRRTTRWLGTVAAILLVAAGIFLWTLGMFSSSAERFFRPEGPRAPVSALFFSGDMGLRYGMGPATARLLAAHGIPVLGFNSFVLFHTRRTLTETDAIVAGAVREALRHTGGGRLVLIGQSYGADVLQTGLAALPAPLRAHVAGIVLVVPGETVFLRADPTGLVYRGTPDSSGVATANRLRFAPLTCIYGREETDSLCPKLSLPGATVIGMPGGHFLHRDAPAVGRNVLAAVARVA